MGCELRKSPMRCMTVAFDKLTLKMSGDITLRDFVKTFQEFQKLLNSVTQEINKRKNVEWNIDDLKGGSAEVTINGVSENIENIERVVTAVGSIAICLSENRVIPYPEYIARQAKRLTHVINGKVSEIHIVAGNNEASITERIADIFPRHLMTVARHIPTTYEIYQAGTD